MKLTPDLLAAAYELLRETAPFSGWALPESEDVTFTPLRTTRLWGDCAKLLSGKFRVRLSSTKHTRLTAVLATMAHEMIHLHLDYAGAKDNSDHGRVFRRLAAQVCRHHPEFDPATF